MGKEHHEKRGFLYAASRESHVREAARSWESVRRHHPDAGAVLFTDCPELGAQLFPEVRPLPVVTGTHADKILPLAESPFDRTIFLDTDTCAIGPLDDLFDLLGSYDVLLARDPWAHHVEGTPDPVRQYNSGMMALRTQSADVRAFAREWSAHYEALVERRSRYVGDQYSLQELLPFSGLRWMILSAEYNFRTVAPAYLRGHERVRLLHGRQKGLADIGHRVNRHPGSFRIFFPNLRTLAEAEIFVGSPAATIALRTLLLPVKAFFRIARLIPALRRRWSGKAGGL